MQFVRWLAEIWGLQKRRIINLVMEPALAISIFNSGQQYRLECLGGWGTNVDVLDHRRVRVGTPLFTLFGLLCECTWTGSRKCIRSYAQGIKSDRVLNLALVHNMEVWCFDEMELWGVGHHTRTPASFMVCSVYSSYTADEFEGEYWLCSSYPMPWRWSIGMNMSTFNQQSRISDVISAVFGMRVMKQVNSTRLATIQLLVSQYPLFLEIVDINVTVTGDIDLPKYPKTALLLVTIIADCATDLIFVQSKSTKEQEQKPACPSSRAHHLQLRT